MCYEHTPESRRLLAEADRHICAECYAGRPCDTAARLKRESKEAMTVKEGCR